MARIRYLTPDFFLDEDINSLPFEVRLAFAGLWCYADREGRLEDRPAFLKAVLFPYDRKVSMDRCLDMLSDREKPFITRYKEGAKGYIQIVNFCKHQHPHHTERQSRIPPPPTLTVYKEKDKEKDKEKCPSRSSELTNGDLTVKVPNNGELAYQVDEIFGYFVSKTGKNMKLTDERKSLIKSRLKEGRTVEEILVAINHFVKDDWPDRHKYIDLVYVIGKRRGVDNLDRWLHTTPKKDDKPPMGAAGRML